MSDQYRHGADLRVGMPALSRLHDDPERYRRAYVMLSEKLAMLTVPPAALMVVTADWLLPCCWGAMARLGADRRGLGCSWPLLWPSPGLLFVPGAGSELAQVRHDRYDHRHRLDTDRPTVRARRRRCQFRLELHVRACADMLLAGRTQRTSHGRGPLCVGRAVGDCGLRSLAAVFAFRHLRWIQSASRSRLFCSAPASPSPSPRLFRLHRAAVAVS